MTTHGTFTFDAENDADCQAFTFTSDNNGNDQTSAGVISSANTAAEFCWDEDGGNSGSVGPDSGQGGDPDGYLYTECSSPGASGDLYTMTFDTVLNASVEQWQFNFYSMQRGPSQDDNQSTFEVQINESSGGWFTVTGWYFGGNGVDVLASTWVSRSVDLSDSGANVDSSTEVRILITNVAATAWHGDIGIDTLTIIGTTLGIVGTAAAVLSSSITGTASGTVATPTTKYVRGLLYMSDGETLVADGKVVRMYDATDDSFMAETTISDQTTYNFSFTDIHVVHHDTYVILAPGQGLTNDETVCTKFITPV
jgi:hypothetical protein